MVELQNKIKLDPEVINSTVHNEYVYTGFHQLFHFIWKAFSLDDFMMMYTRKRWRRRKWSYSSWSSNNNKHRAAYSTQLINLLYCRNLYTRYDTVYIHFITLPPTHIITGANYLIIINAMSAFIGCTYTFFLSWCRYYSLTKNKLNILIKN